MENFGEIFAGLLTPEWVITAVFNLALLVAVYVRSKVSPSPTSSDNDATGSCIGAAKVTIINNLYGAGFTRRKNVRRRKILRSFVETVGPENAVTDQEN